MNPFLLGPWCANLQSPYKRWARKFLRSVRENGEFQQALNTVVDAGCKPNVIAFLLLCFSASPPVGEEGWERLKSAHKSSIADLRKLGGLLADAASIVRKLDSNPVTAISNDLRYVLSDEHSRLEKPITAVLEEAAEYVLAGPEALAFFESGKSVIPEFWMVTLENYIFESTGKEHYPEIADLLVPAFHAHGRLKGKHGYTARTVAKMVERFRKHFDGSTRYDEGSYTARQARAILAMVMPRSRTRTFSVRKFRR